MDKAKIHNSLSKILKGTKDELLMTEKLLDLVIDADTIELDTQYKIVLLISSMILIKKSGYRRLVYTEHHNYIIGILKPMVTYEKPFVCKLLFCWLDWMCDDPDSSKTYDIILAHLGCKLIKLPNNKGYQVV